MRNTKKKHITREEVEILDTSMMLLNLEQRVRFIEKQLEKFILDEEFMYFERYIDMVTFSRATHDSVDFINNYKDLFKGEIWAGGNNKDLTILEDDRFLNLVTPEDLEKAFDSFNEETLNWNVYNNIKNIIPEKAKEIFPKLRLLINDGSFVMENREALTTEFFMKTKRITLTLEEAEYAIDRPMNADLYLSIIFNTKNRQFILKNLNDIREITPIAVFPIQLAKEAVKVLKGEDFGLFLDVLEKYAYSTLNYPDFLEHILLYIRDIPEEVLIRLKPYFEREDLGGVLKTYAIGNGYTNF